MRRLPVSRLLALLASMAILVMAGCSKPASTPPAATESATPSAASSSQETEAPKVEPVKVGIIQPLTGSVSLDGTSFVNGARLAADQINAAGGIQLDLKVEDGQCKPDISASAAEKLINDDKVAVLIGAFCSGATAGVIPVSEENQVPLVSGVSSSPQLTAERHDWFFRIPPTESMLAAAAAPFLTGELDVNNVAFLAVNDDWGRGTLKAQEELLKSNGINIVTTEFFSHGETNFTPFLTKIQGMNPDAVFFVAETQDASLAIQQYDQMGLTYEKLGVGAMAGAKFIELTGKAAEGIIAIVPYAFTLDTAANKEFVAAYEKTYGAKPDKYAVAGFDTMTVVAEAIKQAGGGDAMAIRDALEMTEVPVIQGTVKFNEMHQAFTRAMITRNDGGVPMVLKAADTK